MELKIDEERINMTCGIAIRAIFSGKYGTYDLAQLDRESFLKWLSNDIVITTNTLFALLDHERVTCHELFNVTKASTSDDNQNEN